MKLLPSRHTTHVLLLLAAAVAIISVALPRKAGRKTYDYHVGDPWRYSKLIAQVEIDRRLPEERLREIADSVTAAWVPYYTRDDLRSERLLDSLHTELLRTGVADGSRALVEREVKTLLADGIVDNATADSIAAGLLPTVKMAINGKGVEVSTAHTHSSRSAYTLLDSLLTAAGDEQALQQVGITRFLEPNLTRDEVSNNKFLPGVIKDNTPDLGVFRKGEAIVSDGQRITPQIKSDLDNYFATLDSLENAKYTGREHPKAGQVVVVSLLMLVFFMYVKRLRPRTYAKMSSMVFLISLITVFTALVLLVVSFKFNLLYAIPFALVPIVVTAFLDARTSFFTHMVVVLICSLAVKEQGEFIVLQFVAGVIATVMTQALTTRSQLVKCAILIFVSYCVGYVGMELVGQHSMSTVDWHIGMYFAINCVVLSFAYFVIFIVEKIFGFTSLVTLVELSDINNRVLRELAEACPGTFQHALQVANIGQEAALKVGASPQLVRAGALYHDIGKIDNPAFFTENQSGVNPHDALQPEQSARIIIEHVTGGLRRAERARLPQVVRDMIAQHHGRGMVKYFYTKACQAAPEGATVDPAPYTYPGPDPQTREAAILMMADACEAAAKSLKAYNRDAISELVGRIIDGQVADGRFRQAPISFSDVEEVKRVFVERLCAFYHTRISYPDAKQ